MSEYLHKRIADAVRPSGSKRLVFFSCDVTHFAGHVENMPTYLLLQGTACRGRNFYSTDVHVLRNFYILWSVVINTINKNSDLSSQKCEL
jgi:hypothetical protein